MPPSPTVSLLDRLPAKRRSPAVPAIADGASRAFDDGLKEAIRVFDNASVLTTGGTGSFGRRLVETLLRHGKARRVIVFSRDEFKQYEMQQQLSALPSESMRFFIGDVRDGDRLDLATREVDYIVHAAALKHVPAAEYNPFECIRTNVSGAENVVRAALRNGVKKVLALSTDKAANPINLYGASKLASDKIFIAANNLSGSVGTRFAVVRYGNVVGSRGSVIPFFRKLLAEGTDHLPITDERMTRFWITLQQGVNFVITSISSMQGGEIFVPKIPSMRMLDLARCLAPDLPTRVVGIRPGEKLHEIMCPADDSHLTLEFGDHFLIRPTIQFVSEVEFTRNRLDESGAPVEQGFEYHSGRNSHFLGIEEIIAFNRLAGVA